MTTVELTDDNFETTIKDNDIVHGKLNTEAAQRIAAAAGITAIPTLMAFREGVLVYNQAGALPAPALAQVVESVKNLDMREVRTDIAAQNGKVRAGELINRHFALCPLNARESSGYQLHVAGEHIELARDRLSNGEDGIHGRISGPRA
jgi:hypothetical protein